MRGVSSMSRYLPYIILGTGFFLSSVLSAGSFVPLLDEFEVNGSVKTVPTAPKFSVREIHRGTDGNFGSTSDAGVLVLVNELGPTPNQGYYFSIVKGHFEDALFTKKPVTPTEFADNAATFTFIWLDGASKEQEAFNITVKIVAVSKSGKLSEPQLIEITHQGVQKPWWKFW